MHFWGSLGATAYFAGTLDPISVHVLIQADALKAAFVRLGDSDTYSCASTPDMSDDAAAAIAMEISEQCVDSWGSHFPLHTDVSS